MDEVVEIVEAVCAAEVAQANGAVEVEKQLRQRRLFRQFGHLISRGSMVLGLVDCTSAFEAA